MPEKDAAPTEVPPAGTEANAEGGAPAAAKGGEETATVAAQPPPKLMKSLVLTGFGGMKMIKVLQRPEPKLADGEVLIRVRTW